MSSTRETVLAALHAVLVAALQTPTCKVLRSEPLPEAIPTGGTVNLQDGDPGEPEVTMSPLRYHYQHRAEIEIFATGPSRVSAFDGLASAVGVAVVADRLLGGTCDWVEAMAIQPTDLPVDGAAPIRAGVIPVILHYSTSDPLN